MPISPTQSLAWQALDAHYQEISTRHLRDLFAQDAQRFEHFSTTACGLLLDYSKHRITAETRDLLIALAETAHLKDWIEHQFSGVKINHTEDRAVLHSALRAPADAEIVVDGHNLVTEVQTVLRSMAAFSDKVRSGEWRGHTGKAIAAVVNIGIGGSDLGPKMVCRALARYQHPRLKAYFVSNLDASHIGEILAELDPETTLFIIASKTFSTQETLTNAQTARHWLVDKLGEAAVSKHFVAVSTHAERVSAFGIDTDHMFGFWDWVGGRYSLWSAIGLPIIVNLGMDNFRALLDGAHAMDEHYRNAPFTHNLPVLQALLGVWYNNFFKASSYAVLPYDYTLELLPMYLQQLEMESNGKRVRRDGIAVDYPTCHILWGAAGNNGQHAFYQLLHQGTQLVPSDFIVAAHSQYEELGHQDALLSNALAQTRALMLGRNAAETETMLRAAGLDGDKLRAELPHRVFPGNQPSTTIAYDTLTPAILGSLIALYEHKTFTQSVIWDVNAFDQWGVELGKQMAGQLLSEFSKTETTTAYDASTNGLLSYLKHCRGR